MSESLLGGFLHGMHIPFRGLIIASASVLFISLISLYSKNPYQILKAGLLVILVKLTLSPHTPVMAFIAVTYQSLLGYIFFKFIHSYKIAAVFLSVIVLTVTGFQKVITLTIIFGFKLWDIIDELAMDLLNLIGLGYHDSETINLSLIVIISYILIHFAAGIFAGFIVINIPVWIRDPDSDKIFTNFRSNIKTSAVHVNNLEKKNGLKQKYLKYAFNLLIVLLVILSILFDQALSKLNQSLIFIFIRAMLVLFIWFKILSPLITRLLIKLLNKTKWRGADNVEYIINLFPHLKQIINFCWHYTSSFKNKSTRIKKFLGYTLLLTLSFPNE